MPDDATLDATGLRCPLPVLRAGRALRAMAAGATLEVRADDPAAPADFEAFCREAGHELLGVSRSGDAATIRIRKAAGARAAGRGRRAAAPSPAR